MESEGSPGLTLPNQSKNEFEIINDAVVLDARNTSQASIDGCENVTKCREAALHGPALVELQTEKVRLRELAKYVGISSDLMENTSRGNISQSPSNIMANPLRQIKPKLQTTEILNVQSKLEQKSNDSQCCSTSFSSECYTTQPTIITNDSQVYDDQYRYELKAPPTAPAPRLP